MSHLHLNVPGAAWYMGTCWEWQFCQSWGGLSKGLRTPVAHSHSLNIYMKFTMFIITSNVHNLQEHLKFLPLHFETKALLPRVAFQSNFQALLRSSHLHLLRWNLRILGISSFVLLFNKYPLCYQARCWRH